ncbi:hypothetical protein BU25DRAFT_448416 [Macroventuria anomochaeta]|uniref:Uncharacterized protein n=1 Tax=Macroventuria anomochaeta TaxID=301207 RepID=A0ACB6S4C2_9PLEO|nr:uncharacterized protein BU25DRAFT_448416 [Macroventuria anomochaeta]KAF2627982.1 hypothetical protein BU25DRAFT_448416 [Macroventuria anomochaeta]
MSDSTRRRGGGGVAQRGLFVDGVWHCDCTPRQPANHFEVKKQGPNQGKWFRTCQKQQNDKSRCKFFLWDGDAHPREAAALANNTRTEPSHTTPKTLSKRPVSPPPYTIESGRGETSRKRGRATSIDLDDEYGFEATDEAFKNELDHVMTAVETPRKAARTGELATPSTKRTLPWNQIAANANGLQTPQTTRTVQADPFSSRLSRSLLTPSRPTDAAHWTATPSSSPYETPTPSRFKDVGQDDLVRDVFALLHDANIKLSITTENDLHTLLSKHTKAAEALKRGRDVTRSTIKARDAKITELSYRISTLEAELEAAEATVKHLQWEVQNKAHTNP